MGSIPTYRINLTSTAILRENICGRKKCRFDAKTSWLSFIQHTVFRKTYIANGVMLLFALMEVT